ncbi:NUDIX domain-containing protein [Streptomyces sp. NBC_00249]|uniref:NUDIX hydrolase n=1 Tax=Streptomyces sp. NBC_00249 TaxID=2975690 RepID=UPI002254BF3B|nr:NUDIX domain-containing protein [Streptomyces sp. NBC_00249]MCX5197156.1 NUDIX domain-containing protein [Streptomyces sp. NBC_00249]
MIVWINGTFSAGKTSTARELAALLPDGTVYDPELIGDVLRRLLPDKRLAEVTDYQDLPSWRRLVVDAAAAMLAELGGVLVVPMTLLKQEYRDEIFGALAARRITVRHVLLAPEETILRERIATRQEPGAPEVADVRVRQWAYDHIPVYQQALGWLTADAHVIDNGRLTVRETAERIAEAVRTDTAGLCDIVQTPEPTRETVASGVLLFDDEDRVLLVDPTYKPGWEFPGGVVEAGEAPACAGVREVEEELGLTLDRMPALLVVDWEPPRAPAYGGLRLLFDGGRLERDRIARLRLPGPELRAWRFVTEAEAAGLLPPQRFERLRWALRARERGCPLYLEAGRPTP